MSEITRSPLSWPSWFPRTPAHKRVSARFGKRNDRGYGLKEVTLSQATSRLFEQVRAYTKSGHRWRIDPDDVIISSDLQLRNDGLPRSGQRKPDDPGVAVYFKLDGKDRCIPCDMYLRIEDNLAAIAATLEALRTIERHGSQMFEAAFTGFDALPSPDHVMARSWRDVLDYYGSSYSEAELCYQRKRKATHPDHGGTDEAFNEVQVAWKLAQEELG
jgi:hypothetical protein